jgi:hypothetical protein
VTKETAVNRDDTTQPATSSAASGPTSNGGVGELLHHITDDVKTIARDEIELVRAELSQSARTAITEASVALLGAIVALIGLGMLCVAAVVALAPLIPALWARLLIFAGVYLLIGGAVAGAFGRRIATDAAPNLEVVKYEAKRTAAGVKETLAAT